MAIHFDHKLHVLHTEGDPLLDPPLTIRSISGDVVIDTNLKVNGTAEIGGVFWPTVNEISDPEAQGKILSVGAGPSIALINPPAGGGSSAPRTATLPYASEVTADWADADVIYLTLGGTAIVTMAGAVDGQKLLLVVRQDATGGRSIAFGGDNIRFGTTAAEINLSTEPEKCDKIGMVYDGPSQSYDVVAFAGGF